MPSSQDDLAPSGAKARFEANVAAIRLARALTKEDRTATAEEQHVLARQRQLSQTGGGAALLGGVPLGVELTDIAG